MSDSRQPHRRRRPQAAQPLPEETPHRIVVSDEDEPEWLVKRVSGAAERRTQQTPPKAGAAQSGRAASDAEPAQAAAKQPPRSQRAKEGEEILALRRQESSRTEAKEKPRPAAAKKSAPRKKPARKPSKKARERRAARIRRTAVGTLCALLLIALGVVAVRGGSHLVDIKRTLDRGDNVFYPNIFVNSIPLEGMTLDEAADVVTRQVTSLISSWRITLRTQDGRSWDITGEDLHMQYDVADQLDQLWAIGHTGSSAERYEQVRALEQEPAMRYTTLSYDLSGVNQILNQIKSEVDQSPVSATRVDDDTKWPPFSYTDDIPGKELDITGLNERICAMVDKLESGVVDLTPTPVEAPITREYLEGQIVQLSSFETSIGKTGDYAESRSENIRIGTEKFNHLIIKSGEQVSFNKITGKRTAANGYQPALELAYGEYREGYGGGICQVSSTLYNAVVNAGLEVRTRYQHTLPSSYVALGLDATVQDDRLDFVFRNNTNADIYISSEYYKGKNNYYRCKFTIYGRPDPNGYTYKLDSVVKEELPVPEPTMIPDKEAQYVVYDDETHQTTKGEKGYVVDVYLVTMDAKGLEISRELKYTDTYKAQTPRVYVGVTPRETPVPQGYGVD
ncbi:MAG: VanW family protein [Candidatus Ventricola sp.]